MNQQLKEGRSTSPLNIVIVGGGIGGLTAAIALRRQGHKIKVFEQSRFANEIGAAILLAPNATSVLCDLGVDPQQHGAVEIFTTKLRTWSGETIKVIDHHRRRECYQAPMYMTHRAHLHEHLRVTAISPEGEGTPVELNCSSRTKCVNPGSATVYLENGGEIQADVLIGADGVRSICRVSVTDNDPIAFPSGTNVFRFLLTREELEADPETRPHVQSEGVLDMLYGSHKKVVIYPCANNKLFNFVCLHPAEETSELVGEDGKTLKQNLLSMYSDFHPAIVKMLSKADPTGLKIWPLFDLDQLPHYHRDRLALIGDAAHPFLPYLGQGAAMAIEDGGSIGIMLSRGVSPEEVPGRLALYNEARYERATLAQNNTRLTGKDTFASSDIPSKKMTLNDTMERFWAHHEHHHSKQLLREFLWRNNEFLRWRQPIVFGPATGPRQTLGLKPSEAQVTTATTRVRTSASLLQNLFPSSAYKFRHRNSVAEMSFLVQSLKNLDWLGGGGYDLFSLYIHDIEYTKSDGSQIHGSYCPVTFENLADPIITDREELGWPKLYSEIDIQHRGDAFKASLSWRGAKWATIELRGLIDALPDSSAPLTEKVDDVGAADEGLIVHKYIPASSQSSISKADAEYDILLPRPFGKSMSNRSIAAERSVPPEYKRYSTDASVDLYDLGRQRLPTIGSVVERLCELPVISLVEASLSTTSKPGDLSGARRISD